MYCTPQDYHGSETRTIVANMFLIVHVLTGYTINGKSKLGCNEGELCRKHQQHLQGMLGPNSLRTVRRRRGDTIDRMTKSLGFSQRCYISVLQWWEMYGHL